MRRLLYCTPVLFLAGCAGTFARDEAGNPEGWGAWLVDVLSATGDAATEVAQDPSVGGVITALLALYGSIRGIVDGKRGVKAVVAKVKKNGGV